MILHGLAHSSFDSPDWTEIFQTCKPIRFSLFNASVDDLRLFPLFTLDVQTMANSLFLLNQNSTVLWISIRPLSLLPNVEQGLMRCQKSPVLQKAGATSCLAFILSKLQPMGPRKPTVFPELTSRPRTRCRGRRLRPSTRGNSPEITNSDQELFFHQKSPSLSSWGTKTFSSCRKAPGLSCLSAGWLI